MSDRDPLNKLSGTTGISGAVDAVFILTKDERNQNTAKLVCTGRDIEHQEFELAFSKETCVWEMLPESSVMPRKLLPPEMVQFVAFMRETVCFRGSSTELAERFNAYADLTMAVKGMKQMMNRWRSQLREQGVSFQNHRSNGLRMVEVFYSSASDPSDVSDV
jgi:hypothetical protein